MTTQQLFTHLDAGALVSDTRTNFLGCPTQVFQWILGVSPCVKIVQKKVSIPALEREKKNVFSLKLCQKKQLYDTSKQCFILLFLASNISVLSIPFFYSHRGEKTQDI
ncbi:hypothetical protein AB205_0191660 [Aquarana catesbeiana]|uniref:Uncharacterized protein n=1 Tax=Aquarana catesbeiana TaxID=8400 RepID=A0A2G9QC73_AQUCT|nr:hypothetical protein AB205_0191660 [Aquarana catesbeiana]